LNAEILKFGKKMIKPIARILTLCAVQSTVNGATKDEKLYLSKIDKLKEHVDFFYSDNGFLSNQIRFILHDDQYYNALKSGAEGGIWCLNKESFIKTKNRKSKNFKSYYNAISSLIAEQDWNDVDYSSLSDDSDSAVFLSAIAAALNVQRVLEDTGVGPGSDEMSQCRFLQNQVNNDVFESFSECASSPVFLNWKAIEEQVWSLSSSLKLAVLPLADVTDREISYFGNKIEITAKSTNFFVTISENCNQCSGGSENIYQVQNQFSIVFNPYDENDEYVCPESFDRVQNICLYMLNDGTDGIEGIDNIQVEISKLKKEDTSDDIDYSDYGPYSRFRLVKQPRMDRCTEIERSYGDIRSDLPSDQNEIVFYYKSDGTFDGETSATAASDLDRKQIIDAITSRTDGICPADLQQAGIITGAIVVGLLAVFVVIFLIVKKLRSKSNGEYREGNENSNQGNPYDMPPGSDQPQTEDKNQGQPVTTFHGRTFNSIKGYISRK
jgi:hypothetical protein